MQWQSCGKNIQLADYCGPSAVAALRHFCIHFIQFGVAPARVNGWWPLKENRKANCKMPQMMVFLLISEIL